jgi:hypothetical protein
MGTPGKRPRLYVGGVAQCIDDSLPYTDQAGGATTGAHGTATEPPGRLPRPGTGACCRRFQLGPVIVSQVMDQLAPADQTPLAGVFPSRKRKRRFGLTLPARTVLSVSLAPQWVVPRTRSIHAVPGHNLLIQLHAQPRLLRHDDVAVHYREALPGQRLPQRPLLDAILEVVRVRQARHEV